MHTTAGTRITASVILRVFAPGFVALLLLTSRSSGNPGSTTPDQAEACAIPAPDKKGDEAASCALVFDYEGERYSPVPHDDVRFEGVGRSAGPHPAVRRR